MNHISVLSCQSESHKYTVLCNKPSVIIQSAAADSAERSSPHRSVWEKDSAVNYSSKEDFLEAFPGFFWLLVSGCNQTNNGINPEETLTFSH